MTAWCGLRLAEKISLADDLLTFFGLQNKKYVTPKVDMCTKNGGAVVCDKTLASLTQKGAVCTYIGRYLPFSYQTVYALFLFS